MRQFLIKAIIFCTILLGVMALMSLSYKEKVDINTDYMASIIDKHSYLNQKGGGKRILLAGGSNLAFGVNSELIEKELNVQTINLGIHGSLGLEFIVNEIINSIRKGDVVVLSIEYTLYNDSNKPDIRLVNHTQNIYPESKKYYRIHLRDRLNIAFQNFRNRFVAQKIGIDSIYNRKKFNRNGDVIGHLNFPKPKDLNNRWVLNKIQLDSNIKIFQNLKDRCDKVGATVFIMYPNYPRSEYEKNKLAINDLKGQLNSKIWFIEKINDPESFVYDDSLFFDTVYHLNAKGREQRTQMLIELLKDKVFNKP